MGHLTSLFEVIHLKDHEGTVVETLEVTGLKQAWEIGRFSMTTRRYVGKREEKITTEYEKLLRLLCFVNEFPKTKWR